MCKSNLILFQFKADITVCLNIPLADIAKYSPGRKVSLVKVLDIYEIHILYLVKYYIMRTDLKKNSKCASSKALFSILPYDAPNVRSNIPRKQPGFILNETHLFSFHPKFRFRISSESMNSLDIWQDSLGGGPPHCKTST
jgi:hypothetical protein